MNCEVRGGDDEKSTLEVLGEYFPQWRIERPSGSWLWGLLVLLSVR